MKIALFSRLMDLVAPRTCLICGQRLSITEEHICAVCCRHLPRTHFHLHPYENRMAENFYYLVKKLGNVAAFYYYYPGAKSTHLILEVKFHSHPEVGVYIGKLMAREMAPSGFFEDIDLLIPMPLTRKRQKRRGYNQCEQIAHGISLVTHLPVDSQTIRRKHFTESQTHLSRWERRRNVDGVFDYAEERPLEGKHVLLLDDVCTTGSTLTSLAEAADKAGAQTISILSVGFTRR